MLAREIENEGRSCAALGAFLSRTAIANGADEGGAEGGGGRGGGISASRG